MFSALCVLGLSPTSDWDCSNSGRFDLRVLVRIKENDLDRMLLDSLYSFKCEQDQCRSRRRQGKKEKRSCLVSTISQEYKEHNQKRSKEHRVCDLKGNNRASYPDHVLKNYSIYDQSAFLLLDKPGLKELPQMVLCNGRGTEAQASLHIVDVHRFARFEEEAVHPESGAC